jgi:hypothetical protein
LPDPLKDREHMRPNSVGFRSAVPKRLIYLVIVDVRLLGHFHPPAEYRALAS